MTIMKYSSLIAAGAVGFFTGLVYQNVTSNRKFLLTAAKPIKLEIDTIVSKDVEEYVTKLTSVMKYGFPSHEAIRIKDNFILSYDRRHRNPNWVMEHLTSDMVEEETSDQLKKGEDEDFFEDETIHGYFRATLDDYRNSDYDKGHLSAAANHKYCQRAVDNKYVLSNITPQNSHFNKVTWQALERHARHLARKHGSVYVCSGPLYLPKEICIEGQFLDGAQEKREGKQNLKAPTTSKKYVIYEVIGENNVAVPTHFFKIILCEIDGDKYDMEAYIMPNEKLDSKLSLSNYMVSRETIERAAGFLIFHQLPPSMLRYINEVNEMEL